MIDENQEFKQVLFYVEFENMKIFDQEINIKDHIDNLNFIKRSVTGFFIILPIVLTILAKSYLIFLSLISIVSTFAFYEWLKNNFRHPILWGLNLIFLYFWFLVIYLVGYHL